MDKADIQSKMSKINLFIAQMKAQGIDICFAKCVLKVLMQLGSVWYWLMNLFTVNSLMQLSAIG